MAKLTDILAQLSKDVEAAGEEEKKTQGQRLADAVADPMTRPFGWQTEAPDAFFGRGQPVGKSLDLDRILALPKRTPYEELPDEEREAIVDLEMAKYSKYNENCRCKEIDPRKPCIKRMLPIQAFTLREVGIAQGLLASITVGAGKTFLNVVAGLALSDCRSILLLIPASLRKQLQYDYLMIAEHFRVPNLRLHYGSEKPCVTLPAYDSSMPTLHVLPYSRLSLPEESDFMDRLQPDAIICDEVDAVRSMASSRGRRLAKYFSGGSTPEEKQKRMATKFLGWTGSLTNASICEFNFLSLFALKDKSPLPLDPEVVEQWGQCLDATIAPSPPGELLRFCNPGEDVRHAFRRRLSTTRGFVIANLTTVEGAQGQEVDIEIREREAPELPPKVAEALASVRDGVRPDYMIPGADPKAIEQLKDALEIAQCAQQVSCGVLYYWKYPRGEPVSLIKEWLARRSDFNKEVREKSMEGETFLDSAMLCEHAAMRFWGQEPKRDDRPEWRCESWPAWLAIRDKVEPQPASYLIDDFLARDAAEWASENVGIVWYSLRALAVKIQELSGMPIHDGGVHGERNLRRERGDRSILASIQSNGRGRDGLQLIFDRQLIVNPPASATMTEQLLGRIHRRNQKSDIVRTEVYLHTPEVRKAIIQAIKRSEYVRDILGADQKLLRGWKEG